jgi:hypothetical protein
MVNGKEGEGSDRGLLQSTIPHLSREDGRKLPMWTRVTVPPPYPCESQKAKKWEPGTSKYNWATLSLGDINIGAWSSRLGVGRTADDFAL